MPGLVFALVFTLFHDLISRRFPYFSTLGALMDARYLRIVAGVWGSRGVPEWNRAPRAQVTVDAMQA
jgi:hypothetical protein